MRVVENDLYMSDVGSKNIHENAVKTGEKNKTASHHHLQSSNNIQQLFVWSNIVKRDCLVFGLVCLVTPPSAHAIYIRN